MLPHLTQRSPLEQDSIATQRLSFNHLKLAEKKANLNFILKFTYVSLFSRMCTHTCSFIFYFDYFT